MSAINRPGTIVRVPDGRIGTVVYNGLDGVGIKWGKHAVTKADFEGTYGGVVKPRRDMTDFPWYPDAMLRDPYPNPDWQTPGVEYVDEDYRCEVIRVTTEEVES